MPETPQDKKAQNFASMHAVWRKHFKEMTGGQDVRGIEIGGAIRMLANCYESALNQNAEFAELSGPRLAILIRLMGEDQLGNHEGINPTQISKYQHVSKNTISALLRGLEEQGLIERRLDSSDKRKFLIRITPAGQALVESTTPGRIEYMNHLASALSGDERSQLLELLEKLRSSLLASGCGSHLTKE